MAGVSTRAAAESAARAGYRVTAVDAFGDLDQHASVEARVVPGRFTAAAAARAARGIDCDAVAYLSSFENHSAAVRLLASGRSLWGNPVDVLRRVRDPLALARALARRGLDVPSVRAAEDTLPHGSAERDTSWLAKPLASGGGRRVRRWRPQGGVGLPRGFYLQEFIDGTPASVVFAAAHGRAVPLGMSWQLVGERAFGASGYQYCGSILTGAADSSIAPADRLVENACALARAVAEEFRLVGVNGVDFIARGDRAVAVEVNPRWSASMELVERGYGLSMFGAHAAACAAGALPAFDLSAARRGSNAIGKAIVFARHDVLVGDTRAWVSPPGDPVPAPRTDIAAAEIRDVPRPGDRIAAGSPVCSVIAAGRDRADCHAALIRAADGIYARLRDWRTEVA